MLIEYDFNQVAIKNDVYIDQLESDIKEIGETMKYLAVTQPSKLIKLDIRVGHLYINHSKDGRRPIEIRQNLDLMLQSSHVRTGSNKNLRQKQ